jgi:hypothetical protein
VPGSYGCKSALGADGGRAAACTRCGGSSNNSTDIPETTGDPAVSQGDSQDHVENLNHLNHIWVTRDSKTTCDSV